jgi:hypothetical protein
MTNQSGLIKNLLSKFGLSDSQGKPPRITSGCRLCGSPFPEDIIDLTFSDRSDKQRFDIGIWMCEKCLGQFKLLSPSTRFELLRSRNVELYSTGTPMWCSDFLNRFNDKELVQCHLGAPSSLEMDIGEVRCLDKNTFLLDGMVDVVITPVSGGSYELSEQEGADLAEIASQQPEGRHMLEHNGIDYWALVRYR